MPPGIEPATLMMIWRSRREARYKTKWTPVMSLHLVSIRSSAPCFSGNTRIFCRGTEFSFAEGQPGAEGRMINNLRATSMAPARRFTMTTGDAPPVAPPFIMAFAAAMHAIEL